MGFALFCVALIAGFEYAQAAWIVDEVAGHRSMLDVEGEEERNTDIAGEVESEVGLPALPPELLLPSCYRSHGFAGGCKCSSWRPDPPPPKKNAQQKARKAHPSEVAVLLDTCLPPSSTIRHPANTLAVIHTPCHLFAAQQVRQAKRCWLCLRPPGPLFG